MVGILARPGKAVTCDNLQRLRYAEISVSVSFSAILLENCYYAFRYETYKVAIVANNVVPRAMCSDHCHLNLVLSQAMSVTSSGEVGR